MINAKSEVLKELVTLEKIVEQGLLTIANLKTMSKYLDENSFIGDGEKALELLNKIITATERGLGDTLLNSTIFRVLLNDPSLRKGSNTNETVR